MSGKEQKEESSFWAEEKTILFLVAILSMLLSVFLAVVLIDQSREIKEQKETISLLRSLAGEEGSSQASPREGFPLPDLSPERKLPLSPREQRALEDILKSLQGAPRKESPPFGEENPFRKRDS